MVTQREEDEPAGTVHEHVLDVDHIFGVRIVRDADPSGRASQLASDMGAEVVRDLEQAGRAFAQRADAGRVEPVVLKDAERVELEERAKATDTASPAVSESTLGELQHLAEELAMTQRIRSDTEAELAERLSHRLSATSADAIQPRSIRQAAEAVTAAEAEVAACEADLAALGKRPTSIGGPKEHAGADPTADSAHAPDHHPEMFDEGALEHNRRAVGLSIGVAAFFAGCAVLLRQLDVPVVVPIIVLVIGLVLAMALATRNRTRVHDDRSGRGEASELLAGAPERELEHDEPAPAASSPAEATPLPSEDEWLARRAQLDGAKERATERLRSAREHWESLVGVDADPDHVDDLLGVQEPHVELADSASKASPTARAVSAAHRRSLARWRVAWAIVGYDEPPEPEEVEIHLERLRQANGESAEAARDRLLAAQTWSEACTTIDRPIVLVEPEGWLPEAKLEMLLGSLPAGAEVVIVDRESPESAGADAESD